MSDPVSVTTPTNHPLPDWFARLAQLSPAILLGLGLPVVLAAGLLVPQLGPYMLIGLLGIVGGIVSVLRPGIGLFLFTLMMYTRASENLTTALGVPSIAPLFTIWLLTGIVMHYGIGGLFNARPAGWQALAIYTLVLMASVLVAADQWSAMSRITNHIRELVYVGLIVTCVRQLSDLRIVVRAMVLGGVIPACISIYQTLSGSTFSFFGFGTYSAHIVIPGEITEVARPAGMVGDPNFYAMALLALIPLALFRARWEKTLFQRQLFVVAAVIMAVASVMTYSRGGYLTLAVLVVGLVVIGFIKARTLLAVGLVLLLMLPILPDTYSGRVESLVNIPMSILSDEPPDPSEARDTSVSGRMAQLMAGYHMFLDHPILGVGTNNYQTHFQEYARPLGVVRRTNRAAHSLYVEIAAETGIVGVAAFGALIGTLFVALRRVRQMNNRGNELYELSLAVSLSLVALLLASVFLHNAYPRYLMVFVALAMATASVHHWRTAPGSRLRFARLRAPARLLTPEQYQRGVVWGGASAIGGVAIVAALVLSVSINPAGSIFARSDGPHLIPPVIGQAAGSPTPSPSGSADVPGIAPTGTASATPSPTAVATIPTPSIDSQVFRALLAQAIEPATAADDCLFIATTQHNVCGDFQAFYTERGGEAIFGAPLSEQFIIAGKPIQFFENAVFEWYTDADESYVLLARLGAQEWSRMNGVEMAPAALPLDDVDCIYEDATGHNMCGEMALFWVSHGGASIFGLPITEQFEDGGARVQYFERSRVELRPIASGGVEPFIVPLGTAEIERLLGEPSGTGPE